MRIAESQRPQPERSPVDAAIGNAIRLLDHARSSRVQRARQRFEYELARVKRLQHNLAELKLLHELEQSVWQSLMPTPIINTDFSNLAPAAELSVIVDKTCYLPVIPTEPAQEWPDLLPLEFVDPSQWARRTQT